MEKKCNFVFCNYFKDDYTESKCQFCSNNSNCLENSINRYEDKPENFLIIKNDYSCHICGKSWSEVSDCPCSRECPSCGIEVEPCSSQANSSPEK